MLAASYSQATAYVVTLRNFRFDVQRVRDHLVLSKAAFRLRISKAERAVRVQASVFDRVERIPSDFMPMPGKAHPLAPEAQARHQEQFSWNFEGEPMA